MYNQNGKITSVTDLTNCLKNKLKCRYNNNSVKDFKCNIQYFIKQQDKKAIRFE